MAASLGAVLRQATDIGVDLRRQREISAEEHAQRLVVEEKSRVARELHDVIAHNMSLITVQARSAPHRLPGVGARGERGVHPDRGPGRRRAGPDARRAHGAAHRGGSVGAQPGPVGASGARARRVGAPGRSGRRAGLGGAGRHAGRRRRRRVGVPDRAGGAQQRTPARARGHRRAVRSGSRPASWWRGSATPCPRLGRARSRWPATGWSACASGPRPSAAGSTVGGSRPGRFTVEARLPLRRTVAVEEGGQR